LKVSQVERSFRGVEGEVVATQIEGLDSKSLRHPRRLGARGFWWHESLDEIDATVIGDGGMQRTQREAHAVEGDLSSAN
jgi:hypothetical protein